MEQTIVEQNADVKYAGFWIRLLARLLDGIVINAAVTLIMLAFGQRNNIFSANAGGAGLITASWQTLLSTLLLWAYNIYMVKKYSATLGKMALRLKIVGDGKDLDWVTVILRETVGKFVSEIILLIGYLMVAWDSRKQGLHDKIAGTLVVYEK